MPSFHDSRPPPGRETLPSGKDQAEPPKHHIELQNNGLWGAEFRPPEPVV